MPEPTLQDLVVETYQGAIRRGAAVRHWKYDGEDYSLDGDMVPPLGEYGRMVENILPVMLSNGTRDEINRFETGIWADIADGAHFRDAVGTAGSISLDPRLECVPAFATSLRFVGDLRIYHPEGRSFYFRGPSGICTVPVDKIDDILVAEITWRTGSSHVRTALPWLAERTREVAGSLRKTGTAPREYDVFLSHKSQDYPYVKPIYDRLTSLALTVFLSEESLPALGSADYMKRIDEALDRSHHMVLVASRAEYVESSWVEAEWRVFINEKRSGRKAGNFVTVVVGDLAPQQLPISLRYYEVIPYDLWSDRLLAYVERRDG